MTESRRAVDLVMRIELGGELFDVVIKAEEGASEEERLGDIHEDAVSNVGEDDDLVESNGYAAHDEQHSHGLLEGEGGGTNHACSNKERGAPREMRIQELTCSS